jgi:hypothetical protein
MTYSILQGKRKGEFSVIKGVVSPAGYPLGVQNKDWSYLDWFRSLTIKVARQVCDDLNKGYSPNPFTYPTYDELRLKSESKSHSKQS